MFRIHGELPCAEFVGETVRVVEILREPLEGSSLNDPATLKAYVKLTSNGGDYEF